METTLAVLPCCFCCLTQAIFNALTDLVGKLHVCLYFWQA